VAEEKKKVLRCPDCAHPVSGVYAEANYGRVLLLDQCALRGGCGGTWFDKWELYFLKDGSMERAAPTVPPAPAADLPDSQTSPAAQANPLFPALAAPVLPPPLDLGAFLAENPGLKKGSGECPVCTLDLKPFKDPMLPPDASIKRCPGCSGLWLNRGDLKRYAEHRAKQRKRSQAAKKPVKAGKDHGNMEAPAWAKEVDTPELATLKKLGKELNAASLVSQATPEALHLDEPPIDSKEFARDVGFLILQALLRLVFKI
jgi:Zn-finger nucleic acid-binding protein